MIPYARHDIQPEDITAVQTVLQEGLLTQGDEIKNFESELANACAANHAVVVNSATAALHIAYIAMGLQKGDRLWTSPITFAATANTALMCGAQVDFVDIDSLSALMCLNHLEDKLRSAAYSNTLPKIVVPVQFAGQCINMSELNALAERYGFNIIEDAAHAIGGKDHAYPVGSCKYSDICVTSFHPAKLITTGEGGAAFTNNVFLAERMHSLRSHGIHRRSDHIDDVINAGDWYYEMNQLGYNYRLTDILAALGRSQLTRLSDYIKRRHTLVSRYNRALSKLPIYTLRQNSGQYSAYHLYVICLNQAYKRTEIFTSLRQQGIGVQVHYIPVPCLLYYRQLGFRYQDYPNAMDYYSRCFSLPLFPNLNEDEQDTVIDALKRLFI